MASTVSARVEAALMIDADVNTMTDRNAMGLPEHYVKPRAEQFADFTGCDDAGLLIERLSRPNLPLETRIAAGTMLGLLGDPRVTDPPQMIDVPAGVAWVGTELEDVDDLHSESTRYGVQRSWITKECPRHRKDVAAFRIGAFPVTNQEYAVFLLETQEPELPSSWNYGRFHPAVANHPVYTVSPSAADRYAAWLAARSGRRFRLPTEVEWEYAAGGPSGSRYPWGGRWQSDRANTLECGVLGSTPIGVFPAGRSWCGALDMAGNVEEFVTDHYHPYPGGELVHDDLFKRMGHYRIARGGAFNRFRDLARNQRRHGPYPRSLYAMGFRLAEDGRQPENVDL